MVFFQKGQSSLVVFNGALDIKTFIFLSKEISQMLWFIASNTLLSYWLKFSANQRQLFLSRKWPGFPRFAPAESRQNVYFCFASV